MKRAPRPGEMALRHATAQTGNVHTFAVCPENYDPAIVEQMRGMVERPLGGYTLRIEPDGDAFVVVRNGHDLTSNSLRRDGDTIQLATTILDSMDPDEAAMLADLEQCAALMLLGIPISR